MVAVAIPVGALITAILVVNNLRDIETDRPTGKRSLAVISGKQAVRFQYAALRGSAYSIPLVFLISSCSSAWVLLPWLSTPLAVRNAIIVYQTSEGPVLNRALAGTESLALLFSVLFSFGLLL